MEILRDGEGKGGGAASKQIGSYDYSTHVIKAYVAVAQVQQGGRHTIDGIGLVHHHSHDSGNEILINVGTI